MPGFKAVPASIRAFGAAVGDLAGEQGHSRPDSWLVEDDDPWQVDGDVPPGVIR